MTSAGQKRTRKMQDHALGRQERMGNNDMERLEVCYSHSLSKIRNSQGCGCLFLGLPKSLGAGTRQPGTSMKRGFDMHSNPVNCSGWGC